MQPYNNKTSSSSPFQLQVLNTSQTPVICYLHYEKPVETMSKFVSSSTYRLKCKKDHCDQLSQGLGYCNVNGYYLDVTVLNECSLQLWLLWLVCFDSYPSTNGQKPHWSAEFTNHLI